jgi:putative membrane-bound dehydrogenase-like protein
LIPLAALALALPQQDLTADFEAPAGARVTLWAESPLLYNPTALDVDARGRVWVAEAVNYRQWNGRNPGRHHEAGDRIVVLEDADGDGVAEKSTVFAQDADLVAPLGIAVIGDAVYVSCSPHLFVYRDHDGDLRADERTTLLTGFGGHDHDHGLHSVVAAPWGGLIWNAGNAGPHLVTDADGWTLRSGSLYNDGGASWPGNRAGLISDDGRKWTGGLVGTIGADARGMRVLAHNFRNAYEAAADSYGTIYVSDNDDDGNGGCRTVALTAGGDYGFFGDDGARYWQADRRPGQERLAAHWHQDDPGVMPMGCENGTGGPTGVAVYESATFPSLDGAVFDADAGRSLVFLHRPHVAGAELALEHGVLLQPAADATGERARWFRPSDVAVAPDGSILVADWYDPGVGGHAAGDGAAYGRILRLAPAAAPPGWGALDASVDSPAPNVRGAALDAVHAASAPLAAAAASGDAARDARALARRFWHWAARADARARVEAALEHADPRLRLAAYQALARVQGVDHRRALEFADDPSPYVRAQVVAGLRELPWSVTQRALLAHARALPAGDRAALECLGIGAHGKEEALFLALLLEAGEREVQDAAAGRGGALFELAWRLHPPSALDLLRSAAAAPGAAEAIARRALDAIGLMPERAAAEAMAALALAGPEARRAYAGWWLRRNADGPWRAHGVADAVAGDFARAARAWQSEVLLPGQRAEADVALDGAEVLWLVVEDGGNGIGYDWGDWIAPRFVGAAGEVPLTGLDWIEASADWGEARINAAADGRPLAVAGAPIADGIGTHANSRIAFRVPEGAVAFRAACAPDDGGAAQPGTQTSIRFAVHLEQRPDRARQTARERAALAGDAAAALALLEDAAGAVFLIEHSARLAADVRAAVAPRLLAHPDLAVRALASAAFPRVTAGGAALPPLDAIAALPGDAARGRELYRGRGTCAVCHASDGLGGAIGPELSRIREKYGARELVDAMLNPSAAIAFGFDAWTLTLDDGGVLVGSILADGERVVVRDLAGQREVVDAARIVKRVRQPTSLMPDALALGLGAQELADLAAFLRVDSARAPQFGPPIELFGAGFEGWRFHLPGGDPAVTWTRAGEVVRCAGKPAGYFYTERSFTNFELTLEWRFDPGVAGNSGVLLRVQEPHGVWPRSMEAQLNSGDAGDVWNIGNFPANADPARTNGRRTAKLMPSSERPLGEWNQYRIRLDRGTLTLEVNGVLQNAIPWCEEIPGPIGLQSEGVPIEFRNAVVREILN